MAAPDLVHTRCDRAVIDIFVINHDWNVLLQQTLRENTRPMRTGLEIDQLLLIFCDRFCVKTDGALPKIVRTFIVRTNVQRLLALFCWLACLDNFWQKMMNCMRLLGALKPSTRSFTTAELLRPKKRANHKIPQKR